MIKDQIIQFIQANYSEDDIIARLDEEKLEWIDSDWEDDGDYSDEYEWYGDHNSGEAEDVGVDEIYKHTLNDLKLNPHQHNEIDIKSLITDLYPILQSI